MFIYHNHSLQSSLPNQIENNTTAITAATIVSKIIKPPSIYKPEKYFVTFHYFFPCGVFRHPQPKEYQPMKRLSKK
jgi:hypothetical protein